MPLLKTITIQTLLFLGGIILLSGCGGGGGSANYEINADVSLVEFVLTNNDSSTQSKEVNVTYHGDGVIVGYPPGEFEPGWLTVTTLQSNNNSARFRLTASHGAAPGSYTTNLRFVTGNQDGSVVKYDQVKVTLLVQQGFAIERPNQVYTATSIGRASDAVEINYDEIELIGVETNWSINKPDWVMVSQEAGQGEAIVSVAIDPQYATYGTNTGEIEINDSISGISERLSISYQLSHGDVTVDTQPHIFSVFTDTNEAELTDIIQVQDDFNGESLENVFSWQLVSSSATWLKLTEDTGSTSSDSASPQIMIDKAELLKLPAGELYNGTITLSSESDFAPVKEYQIEVNAFVQNTPIAVSGSIANQFDFQVNDAAFSSSNKLIAFSDTSAKKLYIVNAQTGKTIAYYPFAQMPETLSISPNGRYLYVSLLIHEHHYNQSEPGGQVAVIDLDTGRLINKFNIDIDPWDIEGTDEGLVFVSAGSGQWTKIKRYNALTSLLDIEGHSRHRINLALSADQQSVYSVTTDTSPGDVYQHKPQDSDAISYLSETNSPYHGDYDIGDKLWLDIQNNLVITEWRNAFDATNLTHHAELATTGRLIEYLTFDYANNKVVIIESNYDSVTGTISSLDLPNYNNYQIITTSIQKPKFVFNNEGEYLVIEESNSGFHLMIH